MSAESDIQSAAAAARNFSESANEAADTAKNLKDEQLRLTQTLKAEARQLAALGGKLARGTADLESFNTGLELISISGSKLTTALGQWGNSLGGKLGAGLKITAGTLELFNKATLASAKFLTERLKDRKSTRLNSSH